MDRTTHNAEVEKEKDSRTQPKSGQLVRAAEAKERIATAEEIPAWMRKYLKTRRAALLMEADEIADLLRLRKR